MPELQLNPTKEQVAAALDAYRIEFDRWSVRNNKEQRCYEVIRGPAEHEPISSDSIEVMATCSDRDAAHYEVIDLREEAAIAAAISAAAAVPDPSLPQTSPQ